MCQNKSQKLLSIDQSINKQTNKYFFYLTTKRQHEIKFDRINFDNVPSV